jgi:hypothetical protein
MMAQFYQSPEPAASTSAAQDDPSASCVRVVGRVRPLRLLRLPTSDEGNPYQTDEEEDRRCIRISSDSDIAIEGSHSSLYGVRHFRLNRVYGESASQEEVFESVLPLLTQFANGYNCTIFMCKPSCIFLYASYKVKMFESYANPQMGRRAPARHTRCSDTTCGRALGRRRKMGTRHLLPHRS